MHRLERIIEGAISGYVNFRGLSTPWTLKTWRRDWSLRRIAHKTIATFVAKFAGAFMCSGPWAVRRSGWHASRSKAGHLEERVARSSQPRCVGVTRAPRRRTVASWEKGGGSNVFFFSRSHAIITGSQCLSWGQVQWGKTQTAQEIYVWCCECKTYCGWVLFNMQHGHNQTGNCGQCTHWANAAYAEKMTSELKAARWNQWAAGLWQF